jgi:DNA (cytosine-5)-methyltransferase 1
MKPTVIDLFSGCGGFSHGFLQAGFEVIGFVEWWKPAITTFLQNHPRCRHLGKDITQVPDAALSELKGKVDIIVGGPPCQGFSTCGNRDPNDKRNQLYREYLRFVRIIQPKYAIIENVQGILSMNDHEGRIVIDRIVSDLIGLDYFVCYKVLKASNYGVPQHRKRLIIIAKKIDLYPEPTGETKTVIEAIGDLPTEENGINAHQFFNTTQKTIERIRNLNQGERIPGLFHMERERLRADKPSKTIVTQSRFIHPLYNRFLTARELARLQSFPDTFIFCGTKNAMVKQVGNAVPPLLAKAIAEKILEDYNASQAN